MRAVYDELVLALSTLTGLEIKPQGQEVANASAYITYLGIPGSVDGAYDGGGPYPVVWQLDVWARSSDLAADPETVTFDVSEQLVGQFRELVGWRIVQMPSYTAPSEDAGGYARAMLKVSNIYGI